MALIDVVKCEIIDGEFCSKFPSEDLRVGSQLVVYPSQTAIFVKGGQICDEFTSGTYTINTNNIPLLNKIINLPFGNNSPFQAEVWFVNRVAKLDIPWGTPQPIQLEDSRYNIIVPIRANGQYGVRINNPRMFLESLIGNMNNFNASKIEQFFRGRIVASLSTIITELITYQNISVLEINTKLMDMSVTCDRQLNELFKKYGVEIVDFSIMSISFPEDDESVIKLKDAKDLAARLKITGQNIYQMERSFDVLEKAASNEGAGGQMMAMGAGLGAGIGVGNTMGNIVAESVNTNPPPIPSQIQTYFLYINEQQIGGQTIQQIINYINEGVVKPDTLVWKQGMAKWETLSNFPELIELFTNNTPPPLPNNK